jgi:tRNA(Ile)-lysidine synthase
VTLPLVDTVATFCKKYHLLEPDDHLIVGVSGGPDSLCLLHLLKTVSEWFPLTLTVAHLNHQLRDDAAKDTEFVQDIAAQWNLPFASESHNIADIAAERKQSVEETARQVRYAFFWRIAKETNAGKIAVGHNADDQVETVLMHFLRGTGLSGLRGMLSSTPITGLRLHPDDVPNLETSEPQIIRPLLDTPRNEIESYCRQHHLSPRLDHTNKDTTLFRNRLRHDLIPELETYNPNIRQVLQRTAKVVTAEVEFLNEQVEKAWTTVVKDIVHQAGHVVRIDLDLPGWLELPLALRRSTLRRAVQTLRRSLRDISFEHIELAREVAENQKTGAQATLPQDLMLTVSYNRLVIADTTVGNIHLEDVPQITTAEPLPINLPGVTPLPHSQWQIKTTLLAGAKVSFEQAHQAKPWEAYLDADIVGKHPLLRSRQSGDTFCPLGLGGQHKKVNEFMIDQKIPFDQRDTVPLLVANDQILWICGHRPDHRASLRAGTQRIVHIEFEQI